MMLVGINPVSDALGRVNKLEVIPLEQLGRPRVDVVVNCSGVFRDLFVNQMNLLDRAIKLAAEQDEPEDMNFVRKHAREQVLRLTPCIRHCTLHLAHLAQKLASLMLSGRGRPSCWLCLMCLKPYLLAVPDLALRCARRRRSWA